MNMFSGLLISWEDFLTYKVEIHCIQKNNVYKDNIDDKQVYYKISKCVWTWCFGLY